MRKSISLALAVVMMLSAMIFTIPASAATITSGAGGEGERVEAPYFKVSPTFDGIVTEAEWGEASVRVEAYDAATKDDTDAYSRFLFWRSGSMDDYTSWSYDMWFRWDENYFYLAVKVKDPDKHVNQNGAGNTWNGDAIQTRIDWAGRKFANNGDKPWSNDSVPDFLLAYTQIAGGFTEAWENTSNRGMTAFSKNPLGEAKAVVAPAFSSYSADTQAGITTYELAIPWAYIIPANERNNYTTLTYTKYSVGRPGNPRGGIGRALGMSLTVLDNGLTEGSKWDAFLAWGSGICGEHQSSGGASCTGSNAVVLAETKISPEAGYPTQDPTSLIEASFSTNAVDAPNVYYDYLAGDRYKENPISYDALSVLTYDDPGDLSTWGSKTNYNGSIVNVGGEHGNVLDFTDPTLGQNYLSTEDGEDIKFEVPPSFTFEFDVKYTDLQIAGDGADKYGSALYNWFGGASIVAFRCGYFFNDKAFMVVDDNGADGTNPNVIARYDYDLKKDVWYKWRFQFDNESCNARLWIDDTTTEADNAENDWGTMIFNVRNRYFYYAGDDARNPDKGTLLIFRQMNVQTQYDNVKVYNFASNQKIEVPTESSGGNGNTYVPTTPVISKDKVTVDGYKEDGKWYIPFSLSEKDGKYLANAKSLSFDFVIDPAKGEFDSLKGLDESAYTVEKGEDGKIVVTITDINAIKGLNAGEPLFHIVIKALDDNAALGDIVKSEAIDYEFEYVIVSTGDATVYVVIAAVVAVIGCAAVVVVRKRKIEE